MENTGGRPGFIQSISLESILQRIHNRIHYDGLYDPFETAAWLGYSLARGHAFADGNKRTALTCMGTYLKLTLNIDLPQPTPEDLADLIEKLAEGAVTPEELVNWLKANQAK